MLTKLSLENFKGARSLKVRISPLTVLCGLNSAGKSTLIQSVAAVRQSSFAKSQVDSLDLHGELIQLGTFDDVLSHGAETETVVIGLDSREDSWRAEFSGTRSASTLQPISQTGRVPQCVTSLDFQMLLADRSSPHPRFPRSLGRESLAGRLGPRGEFTADVLARIALESVKVPPCRQVAHVAYQPSSSGGKSSPTDRLVDQASAWLQEFSPGVRLESVAIPKTDDVRLAFSYFGRTGIDETDKRIRPTNVGFGLTYSLPIIVAALTAPAGSLLLLENPEAHLHPRGQIYLGFLMAMVVSDGVQVVVETHSDHVLNGIRLAVKGGKISAESVGFQFFSRDLASGEVGVQCPVIAEDGSIPFWPDGFFDEWDNALRGLLSS